MTDFDNTNKGVLFKETDKKSEKSPDWTGKLNIDGKDLRIVAWQRESKNGQGFYSLAVSDPSDFQKKPYIPEKEDKVVEVDEGSPIDLGSIPF